MLELEQVTSISRRAVVLLGGGLAAAGLGGLSAGAKKKHKKHKKKKPTPDILLQAAAMTPAKEVNPPNPGDPLASGRGEFAIKANGQICCDFQFTTTTPDSTVSGVHIHRGVADVAGPIVVNFNGQLQTCVPIAAGLAGEITANPAAFYANIHTDKFDGAVRDQLSFKT